MGLAASRSSVSATLSVPGACQLVSELRLSYRRRATCCGQRERTLATFTFPRTGWHTDHGDKLVNTSGAASLCLDRLGRKDACLPVVVSVLAGGARVLRSSLLLGDLLVALGSSRGGCVPPLNFTLERIRCHDEAVRGGALPPAGPAGLHSSSPGLLYILYCNGRLCAGPVTAERGSQRSVVPQGRSNKRLDTPTVGVPRGKSLGTARTFQARLIVHRVDDIVQFGEFFPDVYVKVRMKEPPSKWYRTDVHKKCVNSTALFEYRLVLPSFAHPARLVRRGLCSRPLRLPPALEVVVMDEDQVTRDDKLGGVTLELEGLPLPDDREACGVATISNERVSLFDAAELRRVRSRDAVFPRELTGYWPLLKKKKFNRELKTVGSVLLTVQLLTAEEAAAFPAAPGNRDWPSNRYPRLIRPRRQHGRIRDKVVFGMIQNVEQIIAHATGIPSLRVFIVVAAVVAVTVMHVRVRHVRGLATAAHRTARHFFAQYPDKTKFLIFFYAVSCAAWIYVRRGFGAPKKQKIASSSA